MLKNFGDHKSAKSKCKNARTEVIWGPVPAAAPLTSMMSLRRLMTQLNIQSPEKVRYFNTAAFL